MIPVLSLALDCLATYRLTRLLTEDELLAPVREYVWRNHSPEETKLGYFVTCPWCVSIWAGALVVGARAVAPQQWDKVAQGLSFSALTGLVATKV
jgi:hypothetical protein